MIVCGYNSIQYKPYLVCHNKLDIIAIQMIFSFSVFTYTSLTHQQFHSYLFCCVNNSTLFPNSHFPIIFFLHYFETHTHDCIFF
ncbi:hypothetical protein EUGRSUZ_B02516 [Eucalyptus grandis]|uniref:Uncharacterized protein n=2 Tax=Eucalyptus grandis TaxID=71139 RepID=A0ACC3LTX9_EUCGR|nr:hypothetical protein EUGRSUZ_B02516 [Eucalyptus grandis]